LPLGGALDLEPLVGLLGVLLVLGELLRKDLVGVALGPERRRAGLGLGQPLGGSPEGNIGASARPVGGDGDGVLAPGLGDDRRLAGVVLGVQDLMRDAPPDRRVGLKRPLKLLPEGLYVLAGVGKEPLEGRERLVLQLARPPEQRPEL